MPLAIVNPSRVRVFSLFILCALIAAHTQAQMLFRGTSIITLPDFQSAHPANSTWQTANFYCYFTPKGYISFGWWLGGDPAKVNNTHCDPRSDSYDWYEYSNGSCSDRGQCRFHMVNYRTTPSSPQKPDFEEDYVVMPLQLGHGERGLMFLSYFDKVGGAMAVGVRELLDAGATETAGLERECDDAWDTLQRLVRRKALSLPFGLRNPCAHGSRESSQAVLGLGL